MKLIYLKTELDDPNETFNNCTEVHNGYDFNCSKIAFESDIHATGCTRNKYDIESVTIELATEKMSEF